MFKESLAQNAFPTCDAGLNCKCGPKPTLSSIECVIFCYCRATNGTLSKSCRDQRLHRHSDAPQLVAIKESNEQKIIN